VAVLWLAVAAATTQNNSSFLPTNIRHNVARRGAWNGIYFSDYSKIILCNLLTILAHPPHDR
jgi:hypothetical protein